MCSLEFRKICADGAGRDNGQSQCDYSASSKAFWSFSSSASLTLLTQVKLVVVSTVAPSSAGAAALVGGRFSIAIVGDTGSTGLSYVCASSPSDPSRFQPTLKI